MCEILPDVLYRYGVTQLALCGIVCVSPDLVLPEGINISDFELFLLRFEDSILKSLATRGFFFKIGEKDEVFLLVVGRNPPYPSNDIWRFEMRKLSFENL